MVIMNKAIWLAFLVSFLLLLQNVSATTVSGCQPLSSDDIYVLNQSFLHNASGVCFPTTNEHNVIFDGDGHTVQWWANDSSARIFGGRNTTNVTLKNLVINITNSNIGNNLEPLSSYRGYSADVYDVEYITWENITVYANNFSTIFQYDYERNGLSNYLIFRDITLYDYNATFISTYNSHDFIIDNLNYNDVVSGKNALDFINNTNITINNSNIISSGVGVASSNSTVDVYHSSFTIPSYDIWAYNNGIISFYNTSLTTSYSVTNGQFNIYWQLVVNNSFHTANINIYDNESSLVSQFTDATKNVWLREYYVTTGDVRTNSTPHTINASKSGYYTNSTSIQMDTNKEFTVLLALIHLPAGMVIFRQIAVIPVIMIMSMVLLLGFLKIEFTEPRDYLKFFIGLVMALLILVSVIPMLL